MAKAVALVAPREVVATVWVEVARATVEVARAMVEAARVMVAVARAKVAAAKAPVAVAKAKVAVATAEAATAEAREAATAVVRAAQEVGVAMGTEDLSKPSGHCSCIRYSRSSGRRVCTRAVHSGEWPLTMWCTRTSWCLPFQQCNRRLNCSSYACTYQNRSIAPRSQRHLVL